LFRHGSATSSKRDQVDSGLRCEAVERLAALIIASATLVGCAGDPPTVQSATTPTVTAPPPPRPPAASIEHDGAYLIGRDIPPGNWHTDGPRVRLRRSVVNGVLQETPTGAPCQWAIGWPGLRKSQDSMMFLAQGDTKGPTDVMVTTAVGLGPSFVTKGCQPWHLVR
jgi:hypothetical protein